MSLVLVVWRQWSGRGRAYRFGRDGDECSRWRPGSGPDWDGAWWESAPPGLCCFVCAGKEKDPCEVERPDGRPRIESAYFEEMHCKNACGDSSGDASVRSGPRRREAENEERRAREQSREQSERKQRAERRRSTRARIIIWARRGTRRSEPVRDSLHSLRNLKREHRCHSPPPPLPIEILALALTAHAPDKAHPPLLFGSQFQPQIPSRPRLLVRSPQLRPLTVLHHLLLVFSSSPSRTGLRSTEHDGLERRLFVLVLEGPCPSFHFHHFSVRGDNGPA